jgi:ribosome-associated protein
MTTDSRLRIDARVSLDPAELQFTYIRASGPGGQNVNKVATAAQLRFDAAHSRSLTETVKRRLLRLAGSRSTLAGEIVITAQRFRTQDANRKDATDRLVELVRAALVVPKKRVKTRPSRASKERRLEGKKHRSTVKAGRGGGNWD